MVELFNNLLKKVDRIISSIFASIFPIRTMLRKAFHFEMLLSLLYRIEDTLASLSDLPQIKENEHLVVFIAIASYILKFPVLISGESAMSASMDVLYAIDATESAKSELCQLGDKKSDGVSRHAYDNKTDDAKNYVTPAVPNDEIEAFNETSNTLNSNALESKDKTTDGTVRVEPANICYTIESIMTSQVTDYRGLHSAILGYLLRKNGKKNNAHDLAIVYQWLHQHSCLTTNEHTEFLEALNSDKPKIFVPAKTTFSGAESDIETWLGMTSIEKPGKAFTYVTEYYKLDDYFGSYLNTTT